MGRSRKIRVPCGFCGKSTEKTVGHSNYAGSKGRPLYCGYKCSNRARWLEQWLVCACCHKAFKLKVSGHGRKYCSQRCANSDLHEARYGRFIARWKAGQERGASGQGVSSHIKRYLFRKHESRCSKCGWAKCNKYTKRIPLEVHHKDGDWRNNAEHNLSLLCPNCHALTSTFRARNWGKGRGKV